MASQLPTRLSAGRLRRTPHMWYWRLMLKRPSQALTEVSCMPISFAVAAVWRNWRRSGTVSTAPKCGETKTETLT
eukprot:12934553-Prorocentrum_lima.AAC.1